MQVHWIGPILNASVDVVPGGRFVEMLAVGVIKGDCMFEWLKFLISRVYF